MSPEIAALVLELSEMVIHVGHGNAAVRSEDAIPCESHIGTALAGCSRPRSGQPNAVPECDGGEKDLNRRLSCRIREGRREQLRLAYRVSAWLHLREENLRPLLELIVLG